MPDDHVDPVNSLRRIRNDDYRAIYFREKERSSTFKRLQCEMRRVLRIVVKKKKKKILKKCRLATILNAASLLDLELEVKQQQQQQQQIVETNSSAFKCAIS